MKKFTFSIFNIGSISLIVILIILILFPFNLINIEQAQRTAKWKSTYEKLKYSFELVKLHEGCIIPTAEGAGKIITEDYILLRFAPYFNVKSNNIINPYKFGYRKLNGSPVIKSSQFYFDKFIERKDSVLIGIKQNTAKIVNKNQPLYYMFVDINGIEKPNRIGQDIFIISILRDNIKALGENSSYSILKANCSPIGNGLYCSEYFLLGGSF